MTSHSYQLKLTWLCYSVRLSLYSGVLAISRLYNLTVKHTAGLSKRCPDEPPNNISEANVHWRKPNCHKQEDMQRAFALIADKCSIDPCHAPRAQKLLRQDWAAVFQRFSFTIILAGAVPGVFGTSSRFQSHTERTSDPGAHASQAEFLGRTTVCTL